MTWDDWINQTSEYLKNIWGLSDRFAPSASRLLAYLFYYGLNPSITSGLRTKEKQLELQRRYEAGDPGVVYPPAKNSKHLKGDAIDISTSNPDISHNIAKYLGIRVVSGDKVHFMI